MTKDDVIKIIDGIPFYNYDYIGFLYNKLQEKDKEIKILEQKLNDSIRFSECRTKEWIDYKTRLDQLTNNWNKLEEWVKQRIDKVKYNSYDDVLDKMKVIKEKYDEK